MNGDLLGRVQEKNHPPHRQFEITQGKDRTPAKWMPFLGWGTIERRTKDYENPCGCSWVFRFDKWAFTELQTIIGPRLSSQRYLCSCYGRLVE